jgi:hypothetical protein
MCADVVASVQTIASVAPTSAAPTQSPLANGEMTARERRWLTGSWSRRLLVVAALVIVAEAIPSYIRGEGLTSQTHATRHLASWQIGFGVGLFVAAWFSRMSHAMLALAATFAILTTTATALDVVSGHRGPLTEWVHLVEVIGVFLLWRLTPSHLVPWAARSDDTTRRSDDTGTSHLALVDPTSTPSSASDVPSNDRRSRSRLRRGRQ